MSSYVFGECSDGERAMIPARLCTYLLKYLNGGILYYLMAIHPARSSYRHPLIVKVPPSAGHSDQHRTFLPPKEQIVTSYWWRRTYRWPSRRPCGLPRLLRHGCHQKTTQIRFCYRGISTSSQNQRQKLHRHHELHLRLALAPPPYPLSTYPLGREGSR